MDQDRAQVNAWIAENYAVLRRKALSMRCDGAWDGEDALQEALVYTYSHIDLERGDPSRLILGKVKRLLIDDSRRRHSRYKHFPLEDWNGTVDDLEERLFALLGAEELMKKIGKLSAKDQEILSYVEYPVKDTAEALGISVSAVKARSYRARQHLKEVA